MTQAAIDSYEKELRALYAASGTKPDEDEIKAHLAVYQPDAKAEEKLVILQENASAVDVFFRLSTQWETAGMAGMRVGLKYPSLESLINILGLTGQKRILLDKIQVMERAALEVFAARQEAERQRREVQRHGA